MAVAGALTGFINELANGLTPTHAGLVMGFWGVVVTFLQNWLETRGSIPTILPSPGLVTDSVGGLATHTVGTTDVLAVGGSLAKGNVVGAVLDTAGNVVTSVANPSIPD